MATLSQRLDALADVLADQVDQLAALTRQIEQLRCERHTYWMAESTGRMIGREEVLEELTRQPLTVRREAHQHRERKRNSLWQHEVRPRPNHLHAVRSSE
jgi:hypothetical protein